MDDTAIVVRLATTDDAEALSGLAERAFRVTYSGGYSDADIDSYVGENFGPAIQAAELESPSMVTFVADDGDMLLGYVQLSTGESPAFVAPPAIELARIYADPDYKRRGIGTALLGAAVNEAARRGATTMWLRVWPHNVPAFRFYARRGFRDVGTMPFTLGGVTEDDRVLACPIPPSIDGDL